MAQAVNAAEPRPARAVYRQVPAFTVGITPLPRVQGLVALVTTASAASAIAGLALHEAMAWWLMPCAPVLAAWAWRLARVVPRRLHWDGQCWRLALAASSEPGPTVRIEVLVDLDSALLLRADGRVYLPLLARALPGQWGPLRATLHSARAENPQDER